MIQPDAGAAGSEGALVTILSALGASGAVLATAVWLAANPDKLQIYAGGFLRAFRMLSSSVRRLSVRLRVEGRANAVLDELFYSHMDHDRSVPAVRLQIHMVKEAEDPTIHSDGRVIVRMRDQGDPTRNVLKLVSAAAPKTIVPDARTYLDDEFCEALDLQLIRKVARKLGPQAQKIFHADYLQMARVGDRPQLESLLRRLHAVDAGGLFESVLLQELTYIGMRARDVPPDLAILRQETYAFVERLFHLATREIGDRTHDLLFNERYFRVGFILLARSRVAEMGTPPYVRRMHINISVGAESIYLLALATHHTKLFQDLLRVFSRSETVEPRYHFRIFNRHHDQQQWLGLFRRSDFAPALDAFADRLADDGIEIGSPVQADVLAVGPRNLMMSVDGIPAVMKAKELAWGYLGRADDFLDEGSSVEAIVIRVDHARRELVLSAKQATKNPWDSEVIPRIGAAYTIRVASSTDDAYVVFLPDFDLFGVVPKDAWWEAGSSSLDQAVEIDMESTARVMALDTARDYIRLSCRAVAIDWDAVQVKYPPGTSVTVEVIHIDRDGLVCELEPGVPGWLTGPDLEVGGYEFRDWQTNVVTGQRIDVIVRRFQAKRERFTLQLPRDRWAIRS